jgi:hypothetical protein
MSYIGSTPTTQSFIAGTDYFNGTGSAVNFTLSRAVNSVNDIEVLVNNVEQIPSGYSVSGTTLTFSAAPSAGTSNVYVRYLSTTNLSLAIPSGTSATFNTVTATTLTAGNLAYTGTLTGNGGIINIGSGQVYKDASGNVGIGQTPVNNRRLTAATSSQTDLSIVAGSTSYGQLLFGYTGADNKGIVAYNNSDNSMQFYTNGSERARIDSSGNLLVGTTGGASANNTNSFAAIPAAGGGYILVQHASGSASGFPYAYFSFNTTVIGSITQNGTTAVAYNTSSDYRLKHDIQPMTGALAKVAQLKPVTYKWNADDSDSQGFIAHELQEVVPECVTGEKDAVNEDGSIKPQGIDTSFLVATLTAAIQEQQAIITVQQASIASLTTRITALENK